jgi:hypothetical protein
VRPQGAELVQHQPGGVLQAVVAGPGVIRDVEVVDAGTRTRSGAGALDAGGVGPRTDVVAEPVDVEPEVTGAEVLLDDARTPRGDAGHRSAGVPVA